MDLNPYVDELRHQLMIAAEAGGEDARLLAERLVAPLQSATRLVLLDALSAAAGEITSDLAPGSVEVRLRGRDPEFVVTSPVHDAPADVTLGLDAALLARDQPPAAGSEHLDRIGRRWRRGRDVPGHAPPARAAQAPDRGGRRAGGALRQLLAGPHPRRRSWSRPSAAPDVGRRTPSGGERFTGWARS